MNKKKLILIADDEIGIHESLRIYLTREDYEVYSVFRGDDVMDAAGAIYGNLTDTIRSSSVLKTQRALMLYDVLSGNYSQKAVALFLDHGYFTEYYKDLRAAGLVEDSYRMPAKAYATTVLRETVTVPDNDGVETTYRMIKTDSSYLDTEQLRTVALSTKDKKTARSLEKKIASFEEDFTPKAAVAK